MARGQKRTISKVNYAEEDYDTSDEEERPTKKVKLASTLGEWEEHDGGSLITFIHNKFSKPTSTDSVKVVSFDFDSTLVDTKSGRKFATGPSDWKLWDSSVKDKLLELAKEDNTVIVIFTNQNGIGKGKLTVQALKGRLEGFMSKVGSDVPFLIFAATQEDSYRKPSTGMWDYMQEHVLTDITIDKKNSIYVGDAAGRPKDWQKGKKKDHSCGDRKFALNCGLQFATPEAYFLGEAECKTWKFDGYDIKKLEDNTKTPYKAEDLISANQEVILFVGFPASGKTTFYKRYFEPNGYVHVNRDKLKTPAKCLKAVEAALEEGKSVVVDNTSPSKSARAPYIEAAQEAGVPIRAFRFKVDEALAQHLNVYREVSTGGAHKHVPRIGYNMFKSDFSEPSTKEGFTEVKEIDFIPLFTDESVKKLFYQYT